MSTVILGLDGADPELIDKWIDELPNFRSLKEQGFYGSFRTTEPPITVPAWMCIFSGRSPSDFDAYDFRKIDFDDYSIQVVDSSHFRSKNLIDSTEGAISFRVPGTTPKYPIDGVMVSGFMKGEEMSYEPEELGEEIEEEVEPDLKDMRGEERGKTREISRHNFEENFRIYRYLLENREFETAFSVFRMVDTHMHNVDREEELLNAYRKADEYLGKMLELVDQNDDNLIVLSDHGSVQTRKKLYLNNLLRQKGFLEYEEEQASTMRKLEEKIGSALVNLGLKKQVKKILSFYSDLTGKDPQHTQGTILSSIKKEDTEAFCYISGVSRYGAVWVHDDRFSKGIVDDREKKIKEVKESLEEEEFIDEVSAPRDFLENENIPDLLVKAEEGIVIGGEPYNVDFHRTNAVVHDERGLIAGKGPDFRSGKAVETHYRNIAPTIQALQGEVDIEEGEVLESVLSEDLSYDDELKGLDF